jgi:squalene-hopene/tetraprenyl-beta-curcumene cyclase
MSLQPAQVPPLRSAILSSRVAVLLAFCLPLWLSGPCVCLKAEQKPLQVQREPRPNLSLRNEVQHAIDKGVTWLENHQDAKGFWSTPDHPALTALALVALQGEPTGRHRGFDNQATRTGYEFLLSCVKPDGSITGKGELATYNTAVSMLALLAANRTEYKPVILRARRFLIGLQNDFGEAGKTDDVFDGGIGYGNNYPHSDMGNTLFALEALYYSKQLAADQGLADAKDLNWPAVIHFIQNCQNLPSYNPQKWASDDPDNKGGFVYYPGHSMAGETNLPSGRVALRSYGSISYAGLLSYIYADLGRDDPRVTAVFDWLQRHYTTEENPGLGPQGLFYYFHTMTKALTIYGVDSLELKDGKKVNWREALALRLLNLQQKDGSWANENGRWWEKDPALVTTYVLICLDIIHPKL